MFDRAIRKFGDVVAHTCVLESLDAIRKFMQIRFFGQFVEHPVI